MCSACISWRQTTNLEKIKCLQIYLAYFSTCKNKWDVCSLQNYSIQKFPPYLEGWNSSLCIFCILIPAFGLKTTSGLVLENYLSLDRILHYFMGNRWYVRIKKTWKSSKSNDKTPAARDLLMVMSQTKRANSCFLMSSPRPPSLPQTQRHSLSEGAFQSVLHRSEHLLLWLPLISPLCPSLSCAARQRKASASRIAQELTVAPFLPFWQGRRVRCLTTCHAWGVGGGRDERRQWFLTICAIWMPV